VIAAAVVLEDVVDHIDRRDDLPSVRAVEGVLARGPVAPFLSGAHFLP